MFIFMCDYMTSIVENLHEYFIEKLNFAKNFLFPLANIGIMYWGGEQCTK